jgi:putative DNA-invertase from lambdoid prophage Rac
VTAGASGGRPRGVTYHRVSTRDQRPELARLELRRAAELRGLDLVEEIEETGSGVRGDRPGLARVLELVGRAEVAYVLVWKLDRFGRSTLDVLSNVQRLERSGVTFVATTQGIEVGPGAAAVGRLVLTVLAAVAELERDMISERTVLGLAGARARGKVLGRPKGSRDRKPRRRRRGP